MGDESSEGRRPGQMKASWAEGHSITAGLPERLPDWLLGVSRRRPRWDQVARRGEPHGRPMRVDWGRTLRRWARTGHSDGSVVWRRMPHGPGRLVVLWDVSGSMAGYVEWYFPWLYRLVHERPDVYVFGFGTAVADLSDPLRASYTEAVRRLYEEPSLWGSGTAIGQAFKEWNRRFGRRLLGSSTRLVIISDGWDVGNPDDLESALLGMAHRLREIWWVNPLMVTAGFEAKTRALKIALHYTQHMEAGATIDGLRALSWKFGVGVR